MKEGFPLTSSDGGRTWVKRTGAGHASISSSWSSVATSSDGRVLVASVSFQEYWNSNNANKIRISWDFGDTWSTLDISGDAMACSADGTKILVGAKVHLVKAPTMSPTIAPTMAPTMAPTAKAPTMAPTTAPTSRPWTEQTKMPTQQSPSQEPTRLPTQSIQSVRRLPTTSPTRTPTRAPTM